MKRRTFDIDDPKVARALVKLAWKQFGGESPLDRPQGKLVRGLISFSKSKSKKDKLPALDAWLVIYDEFISWWSSLVLVLFARMLKPYARNKKIVRACFSLGSSVLADLIAIRHLVMAGLDVPAKQLLRSACEHLDVIALLVLRPELAPAFLKTQTDKTANEFWHRYIAKGKAKKVVYGEEAHLAEWREFRKQEDSILSMSAHPSYLAGVMAGLLTDAETLDDYWPPYLGVKSSASVRTLSYAITALFEFISLAHSLPFGDEKRNFSIVPYDSSDGFHKYVKTGRVALAMLAVLITSVENGEDFSSLLGIKVSA